MGNCKTATYVFPPTSLADKHVVDLCVETSVDTLRHSIAGPARVLLKVAEGHEMPPPLGSLPDKTYTEALEILAGSDWTPEEPE